MKTTTVWQVRKEAREHLKSSWQFKNDKASFIVKITTERVS